MRPVRTQVRIANSGGEWNRIYAMARRNNVRVRKGDLGFPTVVAVRDGKVIGFLGTQPETRAVVAGPLVIDGKKNPFLFIRLVEGYENALRAAGVKAYLHGIDKNRPGHVEFMEGLGFHRWHETPKHVVMKREI